MNLFVLYLSLENYKSLLNQVKCKALKHCLVIFIGHKQFLPRDSTVQWLFRDNSLPINTGSLKCLSDYCDTHPYIQGRVDDENTFKCEKYYIDVTWWVASIFNLGFSFLWQKLNMALKNEFLTYILCESLLKLLQDKKNKICCWFWCRHCSCHHPHPVCVLGLLAAADRKNKDIMILNKKKKIKFI